MQFRFWEIATNGNIRVGASSAQQHDDPAGILPARLARRAAPGMTARYWDGVVVAAAQDDAGAGAGRCGALPAVGSGFTTICVGCGFY